MNRRTIDPLDRRILIELQAEPRQSTAALARQVGVAGPTVAERIQRMRSDGVIRGWVLDIDPEALGQTIRASVRVRPGPSQLRPLIREVESMACVTECLRVTGEDCLVLSLYASSMDDLSRTLDRLQRFGTSVTSIVVSSPVEARPLPIPLDVD